MGKILDYWNVKFIKTFSQLDKGDAHIAGGKGASLGEMTQAGIPVPPGFVVLAGTFEQFLKEANLVADIDAVLATVNTEEMHTVEHASEKIQALIHGAQMPADIAEDIQKHFKELNAQYVAVRSSATAEDSASAAWAGQLDSYLNTPETEVLANVQRCWASLFTPRAIFYRFEKELHLTKISVAVVVQAMVASEISGIAFSVHPVTEDHNQLIIEAGYGLGEAIVSGQVTPDSYVVEKSPRKIINVQVNTQIRALYRGESGGNEWQDIPEPKASAQVLTEPQVLELSDFIVKIENHYGFPCDIEWAYEAGKFYIVQSRPITTLSAAPQSVDEYEKVYTRDTTLIIQQAWCKTLDVHRDELGLADKWKGRIQTLHYLHDGVVEVWENTAWTPELMDAIYKKNVDDPTHFDRYTAQHQERVAELSAYWKKGAADGVEELQKVVDIVFNTMYYFDWMYYSSIDERTPAAIKERAVPMREKDVYFDETDRYFRKSLVALYPHLRGYEQAILRSEIANPPTLEVLKERKDHFVVVGEHTTYLGTLESYQQQHPSMHFKLFSAPTGTTTLTGQTGSKGKAVGRVRIMKRKEQVSEAQEGDIIVSTMTTPDFVPAMQKAAAIVTDEGGIMCHAAIVAREMQKPCLIGTQFGTQVFEDGDMVEVDATNGVVRIVESSM